MYLQSTAIPQDSVIDIRHAEPGVGGANIVPDLRWGDAPEGTSSFMVTCFDPDAPTGSGWWHWVVTDIPAQVTSMPEGDGLPEGARTWPNDFGYSGWGGPWPPPGPAHRYVFRVAALKRRAARGTGRHHARQHPAGGQLRRDRRGLVHGDLCQPRGVNLGSRLP